MKIAPWNRKVMLSILFISLVGCLLCFYSRQTNRNNGNVSYIYVTDLALNGDFDDFFDLAVMHKMDVDDLTIVLDNNDFAQDNIETSGLSAINNLLKCTGSKRTYSVITGKRENYIKNVEERCTVQLVNKINKSNKTILITVGSLRDIAAVLDNDNLNKDKIESIYIFAGDYEGTYEEYNVSLDPEAYYYVLNVEIPIYLIPCFQNGIWTCGNNSSYFTASCKALLSNCDDKLLKWFVYEYWNSKECLENYVLSNNERERFYNESRNLWCSSILPYIIDDRYENDIE